MFAAVLTAGRVAERTVKPLLGGRARPVRYKFRSCRAWTTEPRGRKRATEQRRKVRLNAFQHFNARCETPSGLGRGSNEGKNFQAARQRPRGLRAILHYRGALN
jgi:hypothetical protein